MLFTVFAFVVLLGTVFPLLVEALQDRRTVVGAPYFDRLSTPIGLALLFLMAVAPVLPWRKASAGAAARPAVLAGVVRRRRAGRRRRRSAPTGGRPLVAFGLAGCAAGSALRQVVLATRRQGWRGLVGRANGGMIVHLGVIVIAVALVASNSYTRSATLDLEVGEPVEWGGHTFELQGRHRRATTAVTTVAPTCCSTTARSTAGEHDVPPMGIDVGTPSVRTGLTEDVYLTLEQPRRRRPTRATIRCSSSR